MSEPAVHRESAIQGERAESWEGTESHERAEYRAEERAAWPESTAEAERAVRGESTDNDERVAAWASIWDRTPPKAKLIAALIHAAQDRDDDVACIAGLLRSTIRRRLIT